MSSLKSEWALTSEAFDKLLTWLSLDRDCAAATFEDIRRKLVKFFECQGCSFPEEYADETMDRVAKAIERGAEIRTCTPVLYFHGVARNVLKEYWRKPERKSSSFEEASTWQPPGENPGELEEDEIEQDRSQRYECLIRCVQNLSPQCHDLIVRYYKAKGREKLQNRSRLARQLKITTNALRIRAYRIREILETCVEKCLAQQPGA